MSKAVRGGAGFTWVPLGLSAVVMATLLALGALLALSLDAHSRAAPELRTKFLVVRAVLHRATCGAPVSLPSVSKEARAVQIGDWGREGNLNQSEVARAMAASGSEPDFVISTGDNFYVRSNPMPVRAFATSACFCQPGQARAGVVLVQLAPGTKCSCGACPWGWCLASGSSSVRLVTVCAGALIGKRLDVRCGLPAKHVLQQRLQLCQPAGCAKRRCTPAKSSALAPRHLLPPQRVTQVGPPHG